MTTFNTPLSTPLSQLAALLDRIEHPRAAELHGLSVLMQTSPQQALAQLDGNDWWAGVLSVEQINRRT